MLIGIEINPSPSCTTPRAPAKIVPCMARKSTMEELKVLFPLQRLNSAIRVLAVLVSGQQIRNKTRFPVKYHHWLPGQSIQAYFF